MMHFLKVHSKVILKKIALITNVIAGATAALQVSGVLALMPPMLNLQVAIAVILLNMLAHALKPYVAPELSDATENAAV
jgi:hypothetical protein